MMAVRLDRNQMSVEYRKMKLCLAEDLTIVEAVKLATMLNLSRADIDQVESSRTHGFLVLRIAEQLGIMGETKVDELEEALLATSLNRAAVHVTRYKENILTGHLLRNGSESSLASEDSGFAASVREQPLSLAEFSLQEDHTSQNVEAFCGRCNQAITWRAAAGEHSSHKDDIIPGEELASEIAKRKHDVVAELNAVADKMKKTQNTVGEMHRGTANRMMEEVEHLAKEFCQKVEVRKKELLDHLVKSQGDREVEIDRCRNTMNEMVVLCDNLNQELTGIAVGGLDGLADRVVGPGSVSQLQLINDVKSRLGCKREDVNKQLRYLQENPSRVFLRQTPNDGEFAELMERTLAGLVWILTDQLVMVFDERRTRGYIEVKCFNGPDADAESWSKFIEAEPSDSPVSVSAIEYYSGSHPHILLAVGRRVYMLQLSYDGDKFDGIIQTRSHELKMAAGTYITAISAHEQTSTQRDNFIIVFNTSLNVFQYDSNCELAREIQCSKYVSSILSIACVDDCIAVVDNLSNEVLLLKCDVNMTSLIGRLSRPTCDHTVIPWMVLWTGALWLAMWVPQQEKALKWLVSSYEENGSDLQIYDGEFSRGSFPVAISRFVYGVVMCFSDSSIHKFKQV